MAEILRSREENKIELQAKKRKNNSKMTAELSQEDLSQDLEQDSSAVIDLLVKEACDPDNPIVFFPVRHHSPACSWHLQKMLNICQPDCILIEGPENANMLMDIMTDEGTKAPFALYYFYRDKKGYINEEKGDYRCYYPFLDYSPELIGMRYGREHQIHTEFIDLPYSEILIASEYGSRLLKNNEKNNYNDDYLLSANTYIKSLCEKAGVRNFDEFWEKYFEINGLYETTEYFVKQVLTYCYLSRYHTRKEDLEKEGCLSRENYMAEHILEKQKTYKKIMVITGGFHTSGLVELLKKEKRKKQKKHKIEDSMQGVYIMAYSMEAADALNGYASGMPYPEFYQQVWNHLCNDIQNPYEEAVLSSIIATGKAVRKKDGGISAYDEICAFQMAQGLASLRNKKEPGAFDLYDGILSSFIKGEVCISTEIPLILLRKIITGDKVGTLSNLAELPPIVKDFQKMCSDFKLKIASTAEQEITLQLFSLDKHKKISEFFNRMLFLNTGFARKIKGPNLKIKKDRNLIREIWKYKWNTGLISSLIDNSVYGGTIYEACQNLVCEKLKKIADSKEAAMVLTEVFEMNLSEQTERVITAVTQILISDSDFFSLSEALSYFTMLSELSELYHVTSRKADDKNHDSLLHVTSRKADDRSCGSMNIEELIKICIRKLFVLIPSMGNIRDEDSDKCVNAYKNIYNILQKEYFSEDREQYFDVLESLLEKGDVNPCISGCVMGLLYGSGRLGESSIERIGAGFMNGTKSMEGAKFFRGLFSSARDIVFGGNTFISIIDSMIEHAEEDKFMQLLPDLRIAFAYFTPAQTDKIAAKAAAIYGKTGKELMDLEEVAPTDYSYGKFLDAFAQKQMEGENDVG